MTEDIVYSGPHYHSDVHRHGDGGTLFRAQPEHTTLGALRARHLVHVFNSLPKIEQALFHIEKALQDTPQGRSVADVLNNLRKEIQAMKELP